MQPSVLPPGMRIVGDVESGEDFVVFGEVIGDVRVGGALVIEAGGAVRGPVDAHVVIVRGMLIGDAQAQDMIRVDAAATMAGDARAPRVNIVPGAKFRGRVELLSELEPRIPRVPRRATAAGSLVSPVAKNARTVPGTIAAPVLAPPSRPPRFDTTPSVSVQAASSAPAPVSAAVSVPAAPQERRVRAAPVMPRVKRSVASKRGE